MTGLALHHSRRRPSLTPMIDVVFLLLVFFMLASRFGMDTSVELVLAGQGGAYSGPPRLVDVYPAEIRLNGQSITLDGLADALRPLVEQSDDIVVLRPREGADFQQTLTVVDRLTADGYAHLTLVE